MSDNMIKIYLAYQGKKIEVQLPENQPLSKTLMKEAVVQEYLNKVAEPRVGVYGKEINFDYIPKALDRIELYEPLPNDPMKKRFIKAKKSPLPPKHLRRS